MIAVHMHFGDQYTKQLLCSARDAKDTVVMSKVNVGKRAHNAVSAPRKPARCYSETRSRSNVNGA